MKKIEQLAALLKERKTMHNKYLAKRILEQKENPSFRQDQILKEDCYRLLQLLVTDATSIKLKKIDAVIKLIVSRIEESSDWTFTANQIFVNKFNPSLQIKRKDSSFQGGTTEEEIEFMETYKEGLDVISSMLDEKETILNNPYITKNKEDESLVIAIIDFLGFQSKEVEKKK